MMLPDAVITGLTAAGGTLAAVAVFGWKARDWLQTKFDTLRAEGAERGQKIYEKMDAHEALDNHRHEQNLHSFAKLRISMAAAAIKVSDDEQ